MVVISTDPFMEKQSAIHVKMINSDRSLRKWFLVSYLMVVHKFLEPLSFRTPIYLLCRWQYLKQRKFEK